MSALAKNKWVSPEQYLLEENDNASGIRHEYVNGTVYAMAGASRGHNRVVSKLALRLGAHLEKSRCEVFQSDMKLGIQRQDDVRFYYPDIQVSCEEEAEAYYNTIPCLIVEVLSASTARVACSCWRRLRSHTRPWQRPRGSALTRLTLAMMSARTPSQ